MSVLLGSMSVLLGSVSVLLGSMSVLLGSVSVENRLYRVFAAWDNAQKQRLRRQKRPKTLRFSLKTLFLICTFVWVLDPKGLPVF